MPKVFLSAQADAFRRRLHPEQRRVFKRALVDLAADRGEIAPLDEELAGFCRLRIGENRLVFRYDANGNIRGLFAERRRLIYDLLRANPDWLLED